MDVTGCCVLSTNLIRPIKGSLPTDLFNTRVEFCTRKEIRQNKVAVCCLYKIANKQLL